jgi:hypothetical protein
VRYPNGYEITLSIGDADRPARAAILLTPDQAIELAGAMLAFAADAGFNSANDGGTLPDGWTLDGVDEVRVARESGAPVRPCQVSS